MSEDIATQFAKDVAQHEMTVRHDDGLYRHVAFHPPGSGLLWFELITAPGLLVFVGDGESFIFCRTPDMFDFFRRSAHKGAPNLSYWAEKIMDGPDRARSYDESQVLANVLRHLSEKAEVRPMDTSVALAVIEEVMAEMHSVLYERQAREVLAGFSSHGVTFEDVGEWDLSTWDRWFQWACHAIIWGIAAYDRRSVPDRATAPSTDTTEVKGGVL